MRKRRISAIIMLVFVVMLFFSVNTYSLTEEERGDALMYLETNDIAQRQDIMSDFLRSVGFGLAKFLGWFVDIVHKGLENLYDALSFGKSAEIQELLGKYKTIYKFLIILSITGLGFKMIMGGKEESQTSIFNNIATILIIVLSLPWLTGALADMTSSTARYLDDQWGTSSNISSLSFASFSRNLVDLKVVDNEISSSKTARDILSSSSTTGAGIRATKTVRNWDDIKFNTVMDWENDNITKDTELWRATVQYPYYDATGSVIGYTYTKPDGTGTIDYYYMEKGNKGFLFGIGNSYYYRYQVISWVDIYLNLVALTFVLGISMFRLGRIIIEIAQANIYMPIIALFDFSSAKKTKQMFKEFVTFFAGFALCIALLGVFFAGWSYLESQNWNFILISLMKVILCLAVIDGPSVIERVLGIDVGIKSGLRAIVGLNQGMQLAKGLGSGAKSTVLGKPTGRVGADGKAERTGGLVKTAKDLGTAAVGHKGMDKVSDMASTAKNNLSKSVENVTGGYGAAGAVAHGAEKLSNAAVDKWEGKNSDKSAVDQGKGRDAGKDSSKKDADKVNELSKGKPQELEQKRDNLKNKTVNPVKDPSIKNFERKNGGGESNLSGKEQSPPLEAKKELDNLGNVNKDQALSQKEDSVPIAPPLSSNIMPLTPEEDDVEKIKNQKFHEEFSKNGGKK